MRDHDHYPHEGELAIDSTEGLGVDADPVNAGVQRDLRVMLASSPEPWRLTTYRTRRGHIVAFLTNDFDLQPGVVAFLYARRWEEDACFDTWTNDFSQAKAWGKRAVAIDNRVRPAIVTSILVVMLLADTLGDDGLTDTKALRRQARRQAKQPDQPDGTDPPIGPHPCFATPPTSAAKSCGSSNTAFSNRLRQRSMSKSCDHC